MQLPRFRISIQKRILSLIGIALGASLGSYLYIGTTSMSEDKASYVYDQSFSVMAGASAGIEQRLRAFAGAAQTVGALGGAATRGAVDEVFRRLAKETGGVDGALVLNAPGSAAEKGGKFTMGRELGAGTDELKRTLVSLGWDSKIFAAGELVVGPGLEGGRVPVAAAAIDSRGRRVAIFSLMKIAPELLKTGKKDFHLFLLDSLGKVVTASGSVALPVPLQEVEAMLRTKGVDGAMKDIQVGGSTYLVGLQKAAQGNLALVSVVSKDSAFAAVSKLASRFILLGASIFFVAFGLALGSVRGIIHQVSELWRATLKVGAGDFEFRVVDKRRSEDELTNLGESFNAMSGKITDLIVQTVEKARMAKELETAQVVQNSFFPTRPLVDERLTISGKYLPASECSGDWWTYSVQGDKVVLAIGDVVGHGVSAALLTSAAFTAFKVLEHEGRILNISDVLLELDLAIAAASAGTASMTFFISSIDLVTGELEYLNASHCLPYVRKSTGFAPLDADPLKALGRGLGKEPLVTGRARLEPGELIFFYTDGLFEKRTSDGKTFRKKAVMEGLNSYGALADASAAGAVEYLFGEAHAFYGEAPANRPDDITIVVAQIPARPEVIKKIA